MEALLLQPTESSPKVVFDPERDIFEVSGESRPEDVRKFYEPILEWLEKYKSYLYWLKDKNPDIQQKLQEFNFVFEYFNSTSAKYIMDILMKLDELRKEGFNIQINWHYEEVDEDMKESGEEYSRLTSMPFKYTIIKEA